MSTAMLVDFQAHFEWKCGWMLPTRANLMVCTTVAQQP